jgi:hypothetical protein
VHDGETSAISARGLAMAAVAVLLLGLRRRDVG